MFRYVDGPYCHRAVCIAPTAIIADITNIKAISVTAEPSIALNAPHTKTLSASTRFLN
jgi:hypothetical protein